MKKALRQPSGGPVVGGLRLEPKRATPAVLPSAIALFSLLPWSSPREPPPHVVWPTLPRTKGWSRDSGLANQLLPSPWSQGLAQECSHDPSQANEIQLCVFCFFVLFFSLIC